MTTPRLPMLVLRAFVRGDLYEFLAGDIEEEYARRAVDDPRGARRWARREVLRAVVAFPRRTKGGPRRHGTRRAKGDGMTATFWQDLRYGWRGLVRSPAYSIVAVATLAVAIGANTVIFSFANLLVLKPLPLAKPDGLAFVYTTDPHSMPRGRTSFPEYLDWRERSRSFADLAAWTDENVTLTGRGDAERLQARRVTPNLFAVWGLRPEAGRLLALDRASPVARHGCELVLSDHLWASKFERDPSVVSRSLTLNGESCVVVGVMTPSIEIGNLSLVDLWMPVAADASGAPRDQRVYAVCGRLKPGITVGEAGAELRTIAAALEREHPDTNAGWTTRTLPTRDAMVGENTELIFVLLGLVVAFVLMIACANIANLVLSRTLGRRRELAVRAALGATRWALVRQLLAEGLVIGAAGGLLGVAVAEAGLRIIRAAAYEPFFALVVIDRQVFGFALVLSLLSPMFFSTLPALYASQDAYAEGLKDGGRTTGSKRAGRSRSVLTVAQVSLAFVLLIVAGLMIRMLLAINRIDLGFNPKGVLTAQVELPPWKYGEAGDRARYYERLLGRVRAIPGVSSASIVTGLPTLSFGARVHFDIAGRPVASEAARPWAQQFTAGDSYPAVIGLPLLRGRWFSSGDTIGTRRVAVIGLETARRYWPTVDAAVGARIALPATDRTASFAEIIGVVGNTANADLEAPPDPAVYLAASQAPPGEAALAARGLRPDELSAGLREAMRQVDADIPLFHVRTLVVAMADEASSTLILASLFIAFAALALVLATTGLYGVISYSVGQRAQEIGVRMALGALPGHIRRLVVGQGLALVGLAAAIGLAGALAVARALSSVLYGVTPFDPATYAGVTAVVLGAALAAMWVPVRRAIRLDPIRTLRSE